MKGCRWVVGIVVMTLAVVALAQGPGGGGAPMMGGGYGPGMMGGGYGPGMMGGGYGPGMMGGGYGPGMMGGGYGPGMMGGGYGPGMMGGGGMRSFGYGMQGALDLSDDQRKQFDVIHDELQAKNWEIAGKMRAEMAQMRELMAAEPRDRAALSAAYKRMGELRQQRFDAQLAAQERMEGLLTKEQKQRSRRWLPWWSGEGD